MGGKNRATIFAVICKRRAVANGENRRAVVKNRSTIASGVGAASEVTGEDGPLV